MGKSRIDFIAKQLDCEAKILGAFWQATVDQIADGLAWYPEAIQALADHADIWSQSQRAAVCAILSPRVAWRTNLTAVAKMARAIRQGSGICPSVAGVSRNVVRAWETANDGDVTRVSGPKVSAFYANLCGDFQRVTIDVWAARAAGIQEQSMNHLDRNRYKYLERAYQAVANELHLQPAQLQAIVWIVTRGKGE